MTVVAIDTEEFVFGVAKGVRTGVVWYGRISRNMHLQQENILYTDSLAKLESSQSGIE